MCVCVCVCVCVQPTLAITSRRSDTGGWVISHHIASRMYFSAVEILNLPEGGFMSMTRLL